MRQAIPSATARRVAMRRAAHQLLDTPRILDDPLAPRIIGVSALTGESLRREDTRVGRAMRAFMAVRSRFAEDELAKAVARGVRQYVVLGAGLDTFAYRNPFGERLRVFELDHPATQAWKREQLAAAAIDVPPGVTFAAVDFERETTFSALAAAGLDLNAPAFFSWLGVTMYLEEQTVMSVLGSIGAMPPGSGVVFDYAMEPRLLGPLERAFFNAFAERVASVGEPWTTFFAPDTLVATLGGAGFADVEALSPAEINARYFCNRTDGLRVGTLARLVKALT